MLAINSNSDKPPEANFEGQISGLIEREYERISSLLSGGQRTQKASEYPILNFLRGSVTETRQSHENAARRGAIVYWRRNTARQQDYEDQILHSGMASQSNHNNRLQQIGVSQRSHLQEPGMGLDNENLYSFIVNSRQKFVPVAVEKPQENVPQQALLPVESQPASQPGPQAEASAPPAAGESETVKEIKLISVLPAGNVYHYRSKKSPTFTNLLAQGR